MHDPDTLGAPAPDGSEPEPDARCEYIHASQTWWWSDVDCPWADEIRLVARVVDDAGEPTDRIWWALSVRWDTSTGRPELAVADGYLHALADPNVAAVLQVLIDNNGTRISPLFLTRVVGSLGWIDATDREPPPDRRPPKPEPQWDAEAGEWYLP